MGLQALVVVGGVAVIENVTVVDVGVVVAIGYCSASTEWVARGVVDALGTCERVGKGWVVAEGHKEKVFAALTAGCGGFGCRSSSASGSGRRRSERRFRRNTFAVVHCRSSARGVVSPRVSVWDERIEAATNGGLNCVFLVGGRGKGCGCAFTALMGALGLVFAAVRAGACTAAGGDPQR